LEESIKKINDEKYVDILMAHKILGINVMCRNNILSMRQWKKIEKGELKIILRR